MSLKFKNENVENDQPLIEPTTRQQQPILVDKTVKDRNVKSKKPKSKNRRLKVLTGILVGVSALGGGLLWISSGALSHEINLAADDGLIVSISQLPSADTIPLEQNAAREILAANSLFGGPVLSPEIASTLTSSSNSILAGNVMTYPVGMSGVAAVSPKAMPLRYLVSLKRYLDSHEAALSTYRAAAAKPHLAFQRSYENWPVVNYTDANALQTGILALQTRGMFALTANDWETFEKDWIASANLIRLLGEDVGQEPQSYRTTLLSFSYELCRKLLERYPGSYRMQDMVRHFLTASGPPPNVSDAMKYDALDAIRMRDVAREVNRGNPAYTARWPEADNEQLNAFLNPILGPWTEAALIRNVRAQYEIAKDGTGGIIATNRALGRQRFRTRTSGWPLQAVSEFVRSIGSGAITMGQAITNYRLLSQVIEAERIQRTTGRMPSTPPLSGEMSIDPFSGKLFQWKSMGYFIRMWSVGLDGLDANGNDPPPYGVPGAPSNPPRLDDIVVTAWNPLPGELDPAPISYGGRLITKPDGSVVLGPWMVSRK